MALLEQGDAEAGAAFERYLDRLARSLAHVINLLDPDAIVLGGGMSNVQAIYPALPARLKRYVVGGECRTQCWPITTAAPPGYAAPLGCGAGTEFGEAPGPYC